MTSCEPSYPVHVDDLGHPRVDGGDEVRVAVPKSLSRAHVSDDEDARCLRRRLGGVGRDRREVVLRGDREVPGEEVVDGSAERRDDPGRERGDERHEREPDHQRGRRRRRPLRVPASVVAGQEPCRSAHLRGRPPEQLCERTNEARGEERDPEEDEQRAEPHPDEDLRRVEAASEEAVDERREAGARHEHRADPAEAGESSGRKRRPLPHGGDRRHASRTNRRAQARDQGDEDSRDERDDRRPRLEHEPRVREREADQIEEAEQTSGEQQAEEQTDDGGHHADDESLDEDRPENLAARRSERPERRELARPLRDRDREGVRDDERADEERDAAEGEQEPAQEGDELVRAFGVVVGDLLPGSDLRVRREDRVDLREQLLLRRVGLRRDGDLVQLPFLPEESLRRWQVEAGQRRAADREPGRELHDPRELEPLHRALRLDADDLADLEVLLGRGLLVHDHLIRPGPRALDERQRVERRVGIRRSRTRGSAHLRRRPPSRRRR